ncbi:MAG: type II secretion system protein [Planctomycetota bacterium]
MSSGAGGDRPASGLSLTEVILLAAVIGVLAAIIVPSYFEYVVRCESNTTQANLEMIRSAIRSYRSEHGGQSPPQLAALVPAYLAEIPPDGRWSDAGEKRPPADGSGGWTYDPASGAVLPNLTGTDPSGLRFGDY